MLSHMCVYICTYIYALRENISSPIQFLSFFIRLFVYTNDRIDYGFAIAFSSTISHTHITHNTAAVCSKRFNNSLMGKTHLTSPKTFVEETHLVCHWLCVSWIKIISFLYFFF